MQIPHLQILDKTEDWSYTRKISRNVRLNLTKKLIISTLSF